MAIQVSLGLNRRLRVTIDLISNNYTLKVSGSKFGTYRSHTNYTMLYSEWGIRSAERRKVNVLEMKCLRSLVRVSRIHRVRNEEVHRRAGIEKELASRADQRVMRWFGHVERMDEYHMARKVLMAEVSGGGVRGKPRLGWMDGVKVALGKRGMTVEATRQCAKDRKAWRALVHM